MILTKDYCRWKYLTMSVPRGASPSNIVCLYQFNRHTQGLQDLSGNGHFQTNKSGGYQDFYPPSDHSLGISALEYRTNYWTYGPLGLYPGASGAWTVEFIWTPTGWTDADDFVIAVSGDSELEEDNVSVEIIINNGNGRIGVLHEYGNGSNTQGWFDWVGSIDSAQHVAITRSVDTVTYKLYLNGQYCQTIVLGAAQTGGNGANVFVKLGGNSDGTDLYAYIHSLRYTRELYSDDQIYESYLACRDETCGVPRIAPYPADLEDEPDSYLTAFDFPLRFMPNCDIVKTRDEKAINDTIKLSVFIRKYGLPLYPLGVGVEEFCFEPMDTPTEALLSTHLRDGIDLGVDGIAVNGDITFFEHETQHKLSVVVPYLNTKVGKNSRSVISVPKTKVE